VNDAERPLVAPAVGLFGMAVHEIFTPP